MKKEERQKHFIEKEKEKSEVFFCHATFVAARRQPWVDGSTTEAFIELRKSDMFYIIQALEAKNK